MFVYGYAWWSNLIISLSTSAQLLTQLEAIVMSMVKQLFDEGFSYLVRYKMLSAKTWPNWKGRPKDGVKEIMKVMHMDYGIYMSLPPYPYPHTPTHTHPTHGHTLNTHTHTHKHRL